MLVLLLRSARSKVASDPIDTGRCELLAISAGFAPALGTGGSGNSIFSLLILVGAVRKEVTESAGARGASESRRELCKRSEELKDSEESGRDLESWDARRRLLRNRRSSETVKMTRKRATMLPAIAAVLELMED